eukprot:scaffold40573_cov71-Phaeocystis_antarctica.AAC.1
MPPSPSIAAERLMKSSDRLLRTAWERRPRWTRAIPDAHANASRELVACLRCRPRPRLATWRTQLRRAPRRPLLRAAAAADRRAGQGVGRTRARCPRSKLARWRPRTTVPQASARAAVHRSVQSSRGSQWQSQRLRRALAALRLALREP